MKLNNNIIRCGIAAAATLVALSSCTAEFDKWNTDHNSAQEEDMSHDNMNTGAFFAQMQHNVFIVGLDMGGDFQVEDMLTGGLFSGYFSNIKASYDVGSLHNAHYLLPDKWVNLPFNDTYTNVMQPWYKLKTNSDKAATPAVTALANVVKVFGMSRITDMYGPIPYSKFGQDIHVAYDTQQEVYRQFFAELDSAISTLTEYADNNTDLYLADYDNVYQGNVQKWVKFANTVRLRLAMRISYVDETTAKAQAQAAITNKYGLMTSASDDAALHQSSTLVFKHPLWEIGTSWDDEHMSATMDCYLNGYADPRLAVYFQPATATGEYRGVRNGMPRLQKPTYQTNTSRPNFSQNSDMNWMRAAEAYFLMAEARLRWNIGTMTPRQYYEEGIRASFSSCGLAGADTYIAGTALPLAKYTDPANDRETDVSGMLSMLPVAWNETADDKTNLERIMLQKWIALYPDGQEAWSEMRRTGMPGRVHIYSYQYQSEVADGELISRLKYPTTEYSNNGQNTQNALQLLKGKDSAGTRLWWDVKR